MVGVLEPLEVRDSLRRFEREPKTGWHVGRPRLQDRRFGQAAECVVHLNRPKMLSVIAEHLLVRQTFWVELALPWLVRIAAGADVEVHVGLPSASGGRQSPEFCP